ncbi:MAG TPA: JAB domain-containing protein [Ktedonobacterales bacterium]
MGHVPAPVLRTSRLFRTLARCAGSGSPPDRRRHRGRRERPESNYYVVAQQVVYQGTVNSSVVRVAEVFKPAVSRTCPAIVVVHNHPSGDPTPSPEDVRTTDQLRQAGELLDIELLDHVIVGQHKWVSLKERGLGF